MRPRSFGALLAALVLGLAPWTFAHAQTSAQQTLHLYIPLDPHTLNPLLETEADEGDLAGLMFDPLVKFDGTNTPIPVLASAVPTLHNGGITADGRTITVHLRRNVTWHDGAHFDANDVVFTIHAILDERNNVANSLYYKNVKAMTVVDAFTVRFSLKQPQASFVSDVLANYPIVPEHVLGKSANFATDSFNARPVGTGPYRFLRWQRGDKVELEANPQYALGAPIIARIDVVIVPDDNTLGIKLRQHEIDYASVTSGVYNELIEAPGVKHSTEPRNDVVLLAVNQARPLMRDLAVRRAVAVAVNKQRLVQTITHGIGIVAYSDLPHFMYDGHPPAGWDKPDVMRARSILDAAGWKVGADGVRVKNGVPLRLQYIDYSGSASAASSDAQIIEMLRAVGIDAVYKTYATSIYFQPAASGGPYRGGVFDLAAVGWSGGTDPTNTSLYSCSSRIPRGNNAANYCSPQMERLQAASEREYDKQRRNAIVAKIEDLAVADVTYLFLYHTPFRLVSNPALKRPRAGLVDQWFGIEKWSFEAQ